MALPTPHLEKLNATLANDKLPPTDKPRIEGPPSEQAAIDYLAQLWQRIAEQYQSEHCVCGSERSALIVWLPAQSAYHHNF